MKVFISADIEGTAGITNWDEARKPHADYPEHRQQMTREVLAACDGANAAGAKEILIKDAHATGRNILQADLPENVRLIRGWSGHPMSMVQELDKSFDAALFIGYHSKAGDETNPLAHTLTGEVMRMRINGVPTSEFLLHAYAAATVGERGLGHGAADGRDPRPSASRPRRPAQRFAKGSSRRCRATSRNACCSCPSALRWRSNSTIR